MELTKRIKLIWEFRGPQAANTAKHHCKHLDEYVITENIEDAFTSLEAINNNHYQAILVIPNSYMNILKEKLKPHRGQLFTED